MGVETDWQLPFPVKLLEKNGSRELFLIWPDLYGAFQGYIPDLQVPEERHMRRLYFNVLNSLNKYNRLPRAAHLIHPDSFDSSKAGATHIFQELLNKRRIISMLSWEENQDYLGTFPPLRIFSRSSGRVSKHEQAQRLSRQARNYGNRNLLPRFR